MTANRNGGSNDPKADAAVRFAVKVARERGHVSDDDVNAVKAAGYDDAQVIEIVLHVALNTWTNYINEVAKTDIDFPVVTAPRAELDPGAACNGCRIRCSDPLAQTLEEDPANEPTATSSIHR